MVRKCMGCMRDYDDKYDVCPRCGYVHGTPALEAYHMEPGSVLQGRYAVGRVIGFGGFGVTYIGWDYELGRSVAIKEYLPSEFATRMPEQTQVTVFSGDREEQFAEGLDKFVDEAKRLAKFQHTNGIVNIFDSFKENNTAYIVMEYLEGESLKELLDREEKLSVDRTLEVMLPVLYALRDVHKEGIIHRDISPDNIFLTDEYDGDGRQIVKLLDFGAARFASTRHSKSLSVLIKPGYSPKEQYGSRGNQGTWTDVYAVAATMYKMLTGITPEDSMERAAKDTLKPVSKCGVHLPKAMDNAILNAMNIGVESRTQTIDVLIEELEAEDTKRRREKLKKADVGRMPGWMKVVAGTAAAAIVTVVILIATGVIRNNELLDAAFVPEGFARVPNVTNEELDVAEASVTEAGLVFQILDKRYSQDVPADLVLAQSSRAGSLLELPEDAETSAALPLSVKGMIKTASSENVPAKEDVAEATTAKGTLGVIVSAGAKKVFMLDVLNFRKDMAEVMLRNNGLAVTMREEAGDDAPGSVASQSVAPDTEVDTGTEIELVISTGRDFDSSIDTTVPDVVGMQYTDAKALLLESCLYLMKLEAIASDTVPEGEIMRQDIDAGQTIAQNSTISVRVSVGNGTAHVPDVQFKTLAEAQGLLEANHLVVQIAYEDSEIVAKGNVIRQDIEAGAKVDYGTVVTIYISNGNERADDSLTADNATFYFGENGDIVTWSNDGSAMITNNPAYDDSYGDYSYDNYDNYDSYDNYDNTSQGSVMNYYRYRYRWKTSDYEEADFTKESDIKDGWELNWEEVTYSDWGPWSGWKLYDNFYSETINWNLADIEYKNEEAEVEYYQYYRDIYTKSTGEVFYSWDDYVDSLPVDEYGNFIYGEYYWNTEYQTTTNAAPPAGKGWIFDYSYTGIGYATYYRYRTRTSISVYHCYRNREYWTDWSEWYGWYPYTDSSELSWFKNDEYNEYQLETATGTWQEIWGTN